MERMAKIYDADILPVWSHRFGRMLLRDLNVESGAQVLDVACGTGYPSSEILRRMPEDSRLIAIDGSSSMLDIARTKIKEMGAKNVFFRTESATPKLSFADDVYDVVVCNLGLTDFDCPELALADFARVTRPGGEVRCTLPVAGTFQEFFDIYQEVLTKHDKHDTLARLRHHISDTFWSIDTCYEWLEKAGLVDLHVEVDEFTLLFKSSREFFFAPIIEYGPIDEWKRIAGKGQEMQDVFWYIKESIDAYYSGRAFEVTVKAALLKGRVPQEGADTSDTSKNTTGFCVADPDFDPKTENDPKTEDDQRTDDEELDTASESERLEVDGYVDSEMDDDIAPALDAFAEGEERPEHLE